MTTLISTFDNDLARTCKYRSIGVKCQADQHSRKKDNSDCSDGTETTISCLSDSDHDRNIASYLNDYGDSEYSNDKITFYMKNRQQRSLITSLNHAIDHNDNNSKIPVIIRKESSSRLTRLDSIKRTQIHQSITTSSTEDNKRRGKKHQSKSDIIMSSLSSSCSKSEFDQDIKRTNGEEFMIDRRLILMQKQKSVSHIKSSGKSSSSSSSGRSKCTKTTNNKKFLKPEHFIARASSLGQQQRNGKDVADRAKNSKSNNSSKREELKRCRSRSLKNFRIVEGNNNNEVVISKSKIRNPMFSRSRSLRKLQIEDDSPPSQPKRNFSQKVVVEGEKLQKNNEKILRYTRSQSLRRLRHLEDKTEVIIVKPYYRSLDLQHPHRLRHIDHNVDARRQ